MNSDKIATVDIIYNSSDFPATIRQHAEASAHLYLLTDPYNLLLSASPNVIDNQDEIIYRLHFYSYSTNAMYGIHIHDELSPRVTFLNQSTLYINGQHSDQLEVHSNENQLDFIINQNVYSGDYVEIEYIVQNTSMVIGDMADNQVELMHKNIATPVVSNKVSTEYQTAQLQGNLCCMDPFGRMIDRVKTCQYFYYMLELNNIGNCCVHMKTGGITAYLPSGFEFAYDMCGNLPCILIGDSPSPDNAFPFSSNVQISIMDETDQYVLSIKDLDVLPQNKIYLFILGFYNKESRNKVKKSKIYIKYEYHLDRIGYCNRSKDCITNQTLLKVVDSEIESNNWTILGSTFITVNIVCPRSWTNVHQIRYDSRYSVNDTQIILRRGIRILRIYGYCYSTITYLLNEENNSLVTPFQIDLPNYYGEVSEIELLPCRYHLRKMNGNTVQIRSQVCILSYSV